ncbi:MAG: class I SAM-dependent methyltransferase [Planctomycetota bacterium]|jgi:predicted O-methyltransferase YrrM
MKKTPHQMEYRELLVFLAKLLRPHTYVELGIRRGYTFNLISPLVQRAVGVDIMRLPGVKSRKNVEMHYCFSSTFIEQWIDPIDFLFIDADHNKEAVLSDVRGLLPYVTPDTGLIFLHDTYPPSKRFLGDHRCSNAWEAARELFKKEGLEIVTIPGGTGLSILRKVDKFLHWRNRDEDGDG